MNDDVLTHLLGFYHPIKRFMILSKTKPGCRLRAVLIRMRWYLQGAEVPLLMLQLLSKDEWDIMMGNMALVVVNPRLVALYPWENLHRLQLLQIELGAAPPMHRITGSPRFRKIVWNLDSIPQQMHDEGNGPLLKIPPQVKHLGADQIHDFGAFTDRLTNRDHLTDLTIGHCQSMRTEPLDIRPFKGLRRLAIHSAFNHGGAEIVLGWEQLEKLSVNTTSHGHPIVKCYGTVVTGAMVHATIEHAKHVEAQHTMSGLTISHVVETFIWHANGAARLATAELPRAVEVTILKLLPSTILKLQPETKKVTVVFVDNLTPLSTYDELTPTYIQIDESSTGFTSQVRTAMETLMQSYPMVDFHFKTYRRTK